MNFARLNHILIPKSHDERERLRQSSSGRFLRPLLVLFTGLSDEGRVLAVLLLFVGLASLQTDRTEIYVLWSAITGLLVASSLAARLSRLDGVSIDVECAPRVTVGETIRFTVRVRNRGVNDHGNIRVRAPFLTWDGKWLERGLGVKELASGGSASRVARGHFIERGEHYLDPFEAVALAPFGLAVGPKVRTGGVRFMVLPRVAPVESIELPSGRCYQPGGVPQASRTGDARELFGVRPYRPGDSVRDLHVRTWARVGVPHVREYQEEYFTRIGVILDTDKTVSTERRFEAAVSLAAGVVSQLTGGEALIDVLVVGGEVHALTLGRSLGTFEQALDLLAQVAPGPPLVVDELLGQLNPYLSRLSAVLVITEARDALRDELVERINQFGVSCRTLRVVDSPSAEQPKRQETLVDVVAIEGEGALRL